MGCHCVVHQIGRGLAVLTVDVRFEGLFVVSGSLWQAVVTQCSHAYMPLQDCGTAHHVTLRCVGAGD